MWRVFKPLPFLAIAYVRNEERVMHTVAPPITTSSSQLVSIDDFERDRQLAFAKIPLLLVNHTPD